MKQKSLGQQARDAMTALNQEKAVFAAMARRSSIDAWKRIEEVARDPDIKKNDLGKYLASNIWICEQGYGKATQRQEVTGGDGGPLQVNVNIVRSVPVADS